MRETDQQKKVEREMRAERRRQNAKVRWTSLDDQTDPWPVRGTEGLSLVTQITRDVWNLAKKPWPNYKRADLPIRFLPHLED